MLREPSIACTPLRIFIMHL